MHKCTRWKRVWQCDDCGNGDNGAWGCKGGKCHYCGSFNIHIYKQCTTASCGDLQVVSFPGMKKAAKETRTRTKIAARELVDAVIDEFLNGGEK